MTEYDDEAVELTMVIPKGAYEGWELTGPDGLFDESLCTVEDDDPEAPDGTEGAMNCITYTRRISAKAAVQRIKDKLDITGTTGNTIADLKYLLAVLDMNYGGEIDFKAHNKDALIYIRLHDSVHIPWVLHIPNVIEAIRSNDQPRKGKVFIWLYEVFTSFNDSEAIRVKNSCDTMAELSYRLKAMIYDAGSSFKAFAA